MDKIELDFWDHFVKRLKNEKAKAYYLNDINEYVYFSQKKFYDTGSLEAERYYKKIKADIAKREITGSTALRKFRVLSKFASECIAMEEYPKNAKMKENVFLPYVSFLSVYDQAKEGKTIAISDVDTLLAACKEKFILYVIVTLVYRLGLSVPEICRILYRDLVKIENGEWYFSLLRNKYRYMIFIPSDVKDVLKTYEQEYRPPYKNSNESYFLTKSGKNLSVRSLERRIQRVAINAGIPGISLRDVRNSAATLMFAYDAETGKVAEQLGIQYQSVERYRIGLTDRDVSNQASDFVNLQVVNPVRKPG